MNTLDVLSDRPPGPPRGAKAHVALWLDCRRASEETAEAARAEAAYTVHDVLPPASGTASTERSSVNGTVVVGPVHSLAGYRRLMRGLLSSTTASPAARPPAIEYPVQAVDALVNARLDLTGGCEAKAMRSCAGVAGAHLLYDALRHDLRSPDWLRAMAGGIPAPYLLWTTHFGAGPDRGAEYAAKCLFPGTAVALAPDALRTFTRHTVVTGPTSVDLVEARRVAGILDWFGIRLDALD
ncbi:hypothetical protein [Streptomyces sp. SID12501]|uniref:Uncharacterized protein n=1 Tax=Streptomyces sp. SID12501 TaxID=2706042 RepID=A0A6B3C535_9ACTN|nr:hypothetical protein [Streptomyces sp. SID12501]NEC91779.1 hypothetical protein [Streptomyces sp. SID12501]